MPILALCCALLGILWRFQHTIIFHNPNRFIYSDMTLYVSRADEFLRSWSSLNAYSFTHPIGYSVLLAVLFHLDKTRALAVVAQFVISALAPFAIFALGRRLFGSITAYLALAVSSIYFPFVDYGGYFLSEIVLIAALPAFFWCFFAAIEKESAWGRGVAALFVGIFASLLISFKSYVIPGFILLIPVFLFFYRKIPFRQRLSITAISIVASLPLLLSLTWVCTKYTGWTCVGSNKGPADFLMGHYGRGGMYTWNGHPGAVAYGSPAVGQRCLQDHRTVNFAIYDGADNLKTAWQWVSENRWQALLQSLEHVADSFGATYPWPSAATDMWIVTGLFHYFYLFLILPLALFALNERALKGRLIDFLGSREFLLIVPTIGLIGALMLATGEARYRIPWDYASIILACSWVARRLSGEGAVRD